MYRRHVFDSEAASERDERGKNLKTVEDFMAASGIDRGKQRLPLFADDGIFEVTFTETGEPKQVAGKEALAEYFSGRLAQVFPDWDHKNVDIYSTGNPNVFLVECDGFGFKNDPALPERTYYENHYIIMFDVKDGKIKRLREFYNFRTPYKKPRFDCES